jgi:hypothetical protein
MFGPLSSTASLSSLVGTIGRSPIVVRLHARFACAAHWARIRNSAAVDGFVLAWIASHVREPQARRRALM